MDEPSSEHEERHPEECELDPEVNCVVLGEHLWWPGFMEKRWVDEIHDHNHACEQSRTSVLLFRYDNSRHAPSALDEISGSGISPNHSSEIFPPHEHAQLIRKATNRDHWGSNEID